MRKSLKLSAAAVTLALLLSGCGSNDMDSIKYEGKGATEAPSVSFDVPFETKEESTRILEEGKGEEIKDGDTVLVNAAVYKASDGSSQGDTYSDRPIVITVNDQLKEKLPKIYEALKDKKIGETFAYAKPAEEKTESASAAPDSGGKVEIYTVSSKLINSAKGKDVAPQEGLPTVTLKDNAPVITIPKGKDEPTQLTAQNLIDGEGETIKGDDVIYAKYTGVRWADGKQFDSNWTKEPVAFSLNQVIKGWTEGLKGKKVGDRVLLVIPAEKAYGTESELGKNSQQPAGALVFVVDILGRTDTPKNTHTQQSSTPADHK